MTVDRRESAGGRRRWWISTTATRRHSSGCNRFNTSISIDYFSRCSKKTNFKINTIRFSVKIVVVCAFFAFSSKARFCRRAVVVHKGFEIAATSLSPSDISAIRTQQYLTNQRDNGVDSCEKVLPTDDWIPVETPTFLAEQPVAFVADLAVDHFLRNLSPNSRAFASQHVQVRSLRSFGYRMGWESNGFIKLILIDIDRRRLGGLQFIQWYFCNTCSIATLFGVFSQRLTYPR